MPLTEALLDPAPSLVPEYVNEKWDFDASIAELDQAGTVPRVPGDPSRQGPARSGARPTPARRHAGDFDAR